MKRITKMDTITDLIVELNRQRTLQNKPLVTREWTGAGHWLKPANSYNSIGGIFTKDDEFIGFLEGLVYIED